jgi:hypothetical protein
MITTTSRVVMNGASAQILRQQCVDAAKAGGSFSIREFYETGNCWMIEVTINWPEKT